ncbi:protein REGULATOR OF FATTY ACID COMPOSITION 3, chloroplastic-like [Wolffia australiana]
MGRLSPPFAIPSTHFSSKFNSHPVAVAKHPCLRHKAEILAERCYSSLAHRDLPTRWACSLSYGGNPVEKRQVSSRAKKEGRSDAEGYSPFPVENESFFPEDFLLKKKKIEGDDATLPEFADASEEKLLEFLNLQLESDVKLERMRHYEVVYLIHEENFQEVKAIVDKVKDFVREKKGKIWRLNGWGMQKLAYKIQKAKMANYILMNFEIEAGQINEFKTMLDREERIIRHLVIKRDEAITQDCPPSIEFRPSASRYDNDDDGELEMDEHDGDENFEENVIIVDEEEVEYSTQDSRKTKSTKRIGASSRS